MKTIAWEILLVALAAYLSWYFLLRTEADNEQVASSPEKNSLPMMLTPVLEEPPTQMVRIHEPIDEPLAEMTPPGPELGVPESEGKLPIPIERPAREEGPTKIAQEPEDQGTSLEDAPGISAETLMRDDELLRSAAEEIQGEARQGFETVLVAAPEDQLDIANFFGEELVLVPRASLDPNANPRYFRVDRGGSIDIIREKPPLERFRQYRDLFDYEYARLPRPLRELRKCVLGRSEVFLFAALIPIQEWAVVVGRRREALALSGRRLSDVRRFSMRYQRRLDDGFELLVDEVVFADGSRFRPHTPRSSSSNHR